VSECCSSLVCLCGVDGHRRGEAAGASEDTHSAGPQGE
jgi:hypothetical protein